MMTNESHTSKLLNSLKTQPLPTKPAGLVKERKETKRKMMFTVEFATKWVVQGQVFTA